MKTNTEPIVFRIYLATLIFCPLAFGTVETWSILIMEAGVFLAVALFFYFIKPEGNSGIRKTPGIMPLAALLCTMLFQTIPLPPALIEIISPAAFSLYSQSVWIADPGAWTTLSLYPKGTVSEFLRFSSYAGIYLLTVQLLSDSDRFRKTIGLLSLFAMAVAFFSILQHLAPNGKIYWIRELTLGGMPFGPYVNRNHFAGFMGMLFPVLMACFLLSRPYTRETSLRRKVSYLLDSSFRNIHLLLGFGSVLVALSIFLSLSRGGILSFCVSVAVLGILLSRRIITRKGGLLLIAMVIIIVYAVGWFGWTPVFERFRTIRTLQGEISGLRPDIWRDSFAMLQDFPLTGTGAGSFMQVYPAYRTIPGAAIIEHAHNDYLELLTNGGIIGTGLLLWFIAAVLMQSYRACHKRKDPYGRYILAGLLAGITAFLLHSMTDFNFFIGANGLYLFLLLGLAVNAAHVRPSGEDLPLPVTGGSSLRKILAWGSGGLLLVSVLFNTGQMLSSILRTDASRISLPKASPDAQAYVRKIVIRASFLDPLEPANRHWLGRAAAPLSEKQSEISSYLSATRLSPSNAVYLQALGSAMEEAGEHAAAGRLFAKSVTQARTDTGIIRQYGYFLLRAGRKEEALRQFRAALSFEPQKLNDYTKALVLEGLSDADIQGIVPENAESRAAFAEYLDATGSDERAHAVYEEAVILLQKRPPDSPGIYRRISQFAARKSRLTEALGILQDAAERFPQDTGIRLSIASHYERSGRTKEAVDAYQKVLSLDPQNKTAKNRLRILTNEASAQPGKPK